MARPDSSVIGSQGTGNQEVVCHLDDSMTNGAALGMDGCCKYGWLGLPCFCRKARTGSDLNLVCLRTCRIYATIHNFVKETVHCQERGGGGLLFRVAIDIELGTYSSGGSAWSPSHISWEEETWELLLFEPGISTSSRYAHCSPARRQFPSLLRASRNR